VLAYCQSQAHTPAVEDTRIKKLRSMVEQAIKLHDASEQLIAELNEQLHQREPASRPLRPHVLERVLKPRP
jgi:hypothetical protein